MDKKKELQYKNLISSLNVKSINDGNKIKILQELYDNQEKIIIYQEQKNINTHFIYLTLLIMISLFLYSNS